MEGGPLLELDAARLLEDLRVLSADEMEGRLTGTEGNRMAREYLTARLGEEGVPAFQAGGYSHSFTFTSRDGEELEGINLAAAVRGTQRPGLWVVVTAHYDHLGVRNGEIHNGADDNASGTAAVLHLASHFRRSPPAHSILFLFTDAEETGLQGARAFIRDPLVPLDSVALNVNLDMVSRSPVGELWVAGTHHTPELRPWVESVTPAPEVSLHFGHDRPDLPPGDDWTFSSDHGPFHEAGIPFLYFGVEDHPGYHDPSDTFSEITPDFYAGAVRTVLEVIRGVDVDLPALLPLRR